MLQKGTVLDSGGSQSSFLIQVFTLTKRSFVNTLRDFGYCWLKLLIYIVVTISIGTVYLNVGTGYTSMLGQYQNDLRGLVFDNQTPDLQKIQGEYILEYIFQIDVNRSKWLDLSALCSMIVIYRIFFSLMIKISEDVTPWIRGYIARRRLQKKQNSSTHIEGQPRHLTSLLPPGPHSPHLPLR